jgi:2,3-bisphosphoglycerate-dependent phosphoglycerate mutase
MELYLVRHGQSHNNSLTDGIGRMCDPPLTEAGQAQAVQVAAHLSRKTGDLSLQTYPQASQNCHGYGITRLLCSPMLRALQTTQPIAKALGLSPHVWPDVHEQYGIWLDKDDGKGPVGLAGLSRSEIVEGFPGYELAEEIGEEGWWNRPVETETQWRQRAIRVANEIRTRFGATDERVAVVGHGGFTNELMHELLGRAALPGIYFGQQNTGITRMDFEENEVLRVRYVNRVVHLTPELIT